MAKREVVFEVDLGIANGGVLACASNEEMQQFITAEYQRWQWLSQQPTNGHGPANHAWNVISQQYQNLQQQF